MTPMELSEAAVESYLERYERSDLLRFLTCGGVDDGKSTLIGRLLHDSQTVYDDQLRAAERETRRRGAADAEVDLSLLVDGLRAEREQGITIDVAYRYFSTQKRKFIIADTPGHVQYTRNMATGASTCDLAVILIDATRGMIDQTRRHALIATLLGIRHIVVAINKMDLVGFSEETFDAIRNAFTSFAAKLRVSDLQFIPMSATRGDNVVQHSSAMPWYAGPPLLAYLETVHIASDRNLIDFRFPVQLVVRPDATFRGYAGTITSGVLRRGDEVVVLPSGRRTQVRSIETFDGNLDIAFAPMAVTVTLADDIDVSRGDMLVHPNNVPQRSRAAEAMVVWMNDEALEPGREYLLKQTTAVVPATVTDIRYRMNVNTVHREPAEQLALNEIGRVRVETPRLLSFDPYVQNRGTGAFILIDRITNATVGAGMIVSAATSAGEGATPTAQEWARRLGQSPLSIRIAGPDAAATANALRIALFRRGFLSVVLERRDGLDALEALLRDVAAITIAAFQETNWRITARRTDENEVVLDVGGTTADDAAEFIAADLQRRGFL